MKNNNSNVNINSNNNRNNRTSTIYQKISKLINVTNENNKYKNNNKKNNNYLINNNTISTNSSSVNKNIGYGESMPQLNDTNSENNQKKQTGRVNQDNPEVNKPVYIEPLYSISSSKIINQLNSNNKKRNNSVINGLKYEIKACQIVKSNNEQNEDLDKDKDIDKIKKKEIKKISKNKNEATTSRYLINVNLAKKKHMKMQSLNDFSGIKLSFSNTKKNLDSSFKRDKIKNMKALLQISNHHISNK